MTRTLNTKQYAALINRSERTARRWLAEQEGNGVAKVNGRWVLTLTTSDLRWMKRSLVDAEAAASKKIASIPLGQPADEPRATKEQARRALIVLGYGDIVYAIDHMRIWRGRQDQYGLNTFRRAFAELERMVAA